MAVDPSAVQSLISADERSVLAEIVSGARDVLFRYQLRQPRGFAYISPAVTELIGFTPEECYADPLLYLKIAHPDDRAALEALNRASLSIQTLPTFRFVRKGGGVVWLEASLRIVEDGSGAPQCIQGIIRDVTHREEGARRLELVKQRALNDQLEAQPRVRVLVVDDHQLTRVGLIAVLTRDPRVIIVGEASNGLEAVRLTEALEPDLVMMDVRMPEMNGLDAARQVKRVSPMTSVLLLSMFHDPELLVEAIKAGAAGYVLKDSGLDQIRQAIADVLSGGFPVDDRLARTALRRLASEGAAPQPTPSTHLSTRELEVLSLLAQGSTNREIAEALTITPHTVKGHVEHILAKLGVSDRTQAAVKAIELGLFKSGH
jgi:PAS domain S-box-containing protein